MFQSLADSVRVTQEIAPVSSSSAAVNGAGVDMTGWEGVLFVIEVGAMTAAGTLDAKLQSAAASNFGTAHDISGAALMQLAAASGGSKVYAIDCRVQTALAAQSGDRYIRCVVINDGTHANLIGVTALRYRRSGGLPATAPTQLVEV